MSVENDIFDDPAMQDAEEKLRNALVDLFEGLSQGPMITDVDSTGWTEDGKTFTVYCNLPDGALALWCFESGRPVHYSVHDLGMKPSAPDPSVPPAGAVALTLAGTKSWLSVAMRWILSCMKGRT